MALVSLTDQSIATARVDETTDQIHEQTSAIQVHSAVGGTLTADGSEQTLYHDDEPLGCFRPICIHLNLDDMGAADTIEIKVYYRITDGGGLEQQNYVQYAGADGGLANGNTLATIDLHPCRHGFLVSLNQTATGAYQDYPWELHMEV